jgi:hypothetical protein
MEYFSSLFNSCRQSAQTGTLIGIFCSVFFLYDEGKFTGCFLVTGYVMVLVNFVYGQATKLLDGKPGGL